MTSVRAGGAQHLPFARPDVTDDEVSAVVAAIRSGWLTTGPNAAAFEAEFGAFLGGGVHAVAVNSATAGLHLAVEALGIGPGDEVLLPTWTFTATAEVLRYVGATPVFVDVLPDTLNIDYRQASSLVTAKTVAVMPVHFRHPSGEGGRGQCEDEAEGEGGQTHETREPHGVPETAHRVPPEIDVAEQAGGHLSHDNAGGERQRRRPLLVRELEVVADHEGRQERQSPGADIPGDHQGTAVGDGNQ